MERKRESVRVGDGYIQSRGSGASEFIEGKMIENTLVNAITTGSR